MNWKSVILQIGLGILIGIFLSQALAGAFTNPLSPEIDILYKPKIEKIEGGRDSLKLVRKIPVQIKEPYLLGLWHSCKEVNTLTNGSNIDPIKTGKIKEMRIYIKNSKICVHAERGWKKKSLEIFTEEKISPSFTHFEEKKSLESGEVSIIVQREEVRYLPSMENWDEIRKYNRSENKTVLRMTRIRIKNPYDVQIENLKISHFPTSDKYKPQSRSKRIDLLPKENEIITWWDKYREGIPSFNPTPPPSVLPS